MQESFEKGTMPSIIKLFNFSPLFSEFMYLCFWCGKNEKITVKTILNHEFLST